MDSELKAKAEALGIKVDARWSPETLTTKIAEAEAKMPKPEPVNLFPVTLLKNYRPRDQYEIVGEPAKGPYPGVGFQHKLWAGTMVKLPRDEAIALIENKVTTVEKVVSDAGAPVVGRDGAPLTQKVVRKFPLAERADALPA